MHLTVIGFNYKNTPLTFREALAFDRDEAALVSKALVNQEVIKECLILVTCNRTEVYCIGSCVEGVKETVYHLLSEKRNLDAGELMKVSYSYDDEEALRHLFRVASSLDAMVVGEAQVLGQFKSAYQAAVEHETVGPYLHKACHAAFRIAKRVRSETDIASLPVSVGTLAVELVEEAFGSLNSANVLVIGAGEMGSLVARHLKERGVAHIWIANRSHSSAEILAKAVGGIVVPFDSWHVHMQTADVVITSVGGGIFIEKRHVDAAASERDGAPLIMIDLAIPRNIDGACANVGRVRLFNIDDLQGLADKNLAARREAAVHAERLVAEESGAAFYDLKQIKLAPILSDLQRRSAEVVKSELERLYKENPSLNAEQKESVKACAETIVKKILHEPIRLAKEELARPGANGRETAAALQKIFQISG